LAFPDLKKDDPTVAEGCEVSLVDRKVIDPLVDAPPLIGPKVLVQEDRAPDRNEVGSIALQRGRADNTQPSRLCSFTPLAR